jgi:hypothetical protein
MGSWAVAAITHPSWAPAGVSGGMTGFTGPVEAAVVAGPPGVGALGELHAATESTTAVISVARSGHARRSCGYTAHTHIFLMHHHLTSALATAAGSLVQT